MRITHNPQTGEYLGLQNGQWTPLRIAKNAQGDRLYLGENGWTPLPTGAETPDTKKSSAMSEAVRGLGIGTRNVLEGLGDIPDTFLNQPINAVGRIFGYDLGLGNPGTGLADAMGLPRAETSFEKLISAAQRGAAGALPTLAAGAAPAITKAAPSLASFLSAAPGTQIASSAAGASASEAARQAGGGTGAQIAAGLVGGVVPGVVTPLAVGAGRSVKGAARALSALSDDGQRQIAAENIRAYSMDPDTLLSRLNESRGEIVPGSAPTLGQTLGDAGIAVAEKGRANRGPVGAQFGERYRSQREARQAELEDLAAGIDARQTAQRGDIADDVGRLKPYGDVDVPEADNGAALRNVFNERYGAAKERTRQSYNAIDPDNSTAFSLAPLRDSFMEVLPSGQFAPRLPGEISRFMAQIDDAIANGRTATYRDLQDIRTQLTDMAMTAQNSGDANLSRIATGLKNRLDQYLENAGSMDIEPVQPRGFSPEQMQRFEAAKAARREQAGLFESGANTRMSRGNAPSGLTDGQIMRNYFRPGPSGSDAAKDFLRAFGDDVGAAEIMRDHVVTQFRAASMSRDGALSASKMRAFMKSYGDALSNFPELRAQLNAIVEQQQKLEAAQAASRSLYKRTGTGAVKLTGRSVGDTDTSALDPTEITRFRALQDDIARNKRMEELSAVRGSPTAQNLATQAIMDTVLGRSLGRNVNGLGTTPRGVIRNMASGVVNKGVGLLYGTADERINDLIDRAFLNPEFAKELLENYRSYTPNVRLADIFKDAERGTSVQALRGLLGQFSQ